MRSAMLLDDLRRPSVQCGGRGWGACMGDDTSVVPEERYVRWLAGHGEARCVSRRSRATSPRTSRTRRSRVPHVWNQTPTAPKKRARVPGEVAYLFDAVSPFDADAEVYDDLDDDEVNALLTTRLPPSPSACLTEHEHALECIACKSLDRARAASARLPRPARARVSGAAAGAERERTRCSDGRVRRVNGAP
jgi:hypothetical protein